jgi:formate dehydrogenase iron-sulfur subunit
MNFGDRKDILELAQKHLSMAKKKFPKAALLDPDDVRVIFLVAFAPNLYHDFAVASASAYGISRQAALRRMIRPLTRFVSPAS